MNTPPNVDIRYERLYRRLSQLRWVLPVFIFMASALHESLLALLFPHVSAHYHFLLPVLVYGITGSVVSWIGFGWLARLAREREEMVQALQRAYDDLAETHKRLLAMHDIGREIASAADLQHVLEIAARAPVSLVNAKGSAVFTFDEKEDRLRLDMVWGLSDEYADRLRRHIDAGVLADRCRNCEVLHAHVESDCPLFQGMQEAAQKEGIRSLACLPFGRGNKREGIITAYFETPHGPPEDGAQILSVVAVEIASVIESLRLQDEQALAITRLEEAVSERSDEDTLWHQILDVTLAGWDVHQGAILEPTEKGDWTARVTRSIDENDPAIQAILTELFQEVMHTQAPYVMPDTRVARPDLSLPEDMRAAAGIPLLEGQKVLAVLTMFAPTPGYFRIHHGSFFLSIGYHAGLALSNARLRSQVAHMAVLEERYRLSREIHDGLAQSLTFIGWRLDRVSRLMREARWSEAAHELEEIRHALRDAYLDVREAIDGLRIRLDHPGGLVGALSEYVRDFEERTGIHVHFESHVNGVEIPEGTGIQLMRIVQEGLTNVRKHSGATEVQVTLTKEDSALKLDIVDNGRGFDPTAPRKRSHVGLSSMRERTHQLHGTFTLVSRPNSGTRISVIVPLAD